MDSQSGRGFATTTVYSLHASGLSPGSDHRLELRRTDGSGSVAIDPATVTGTGEVLAVGGKPGETAPAVLTLNGMAPGEPLDIAVISRDGRARAATSVVPRPVEARGAGDCRLTAQLERRPTLGYRVRLDGFDSSQNVTVSLAAGERREQAVSAPGVDAERETFLPLSGLLARAGLFTLAATDSSCTASTGVDWTDAPRD